MLSRREALQLAVGGAAAAAKAQEPVRSAELTRCNAFDDSRTAWDAVASGGGSRLPLRQLEPRVLLPDGAEFRTWEQPVGHQRTFVVAQNDPRASDANPGTAQRPWKTIARAASTLEPGDRVLVKRGIYREWVRPARGGAGPRRMITYQTAPGEDVILSGSDPFTAWERFEPVAHAWVADLPEALFPDGNPFAQPNVTASMMTSTVSQPAKYVQPPYTLPQGLLFENGRRLKQVPGLDHLARTAGAYFTEPGGRRLFVRTFEDGDPRTAGIEITTRPFAFAPAQAGLGFIRVAGFTVERVANCYPVPQLGAISARQGHHWIVEDNRVRDVNALGLDCGRRQTFIPFAVPPDTPRLAGVGHIVRRNTFLNCGICSMQGLGLIGVLVEDNYSSGCGWHDVEGLWETGGFKMHYVKHGLIRHNTVDGTIGGPGMWIDHSIANTRVTANIVVGTRTATYGGIFFEASYRPNLIDHNIVWDCAGHGFHQQECAELTVANNLFGLCAKLPVSMKVNSKRILDLETKRTAAGVRNRVIGNVFYGFGRRGPQLPGEGNTSDHNLFVNPPDGQPFDLVAWQRAGRGAEAHSTVQQSRMDFSARDWTLRQDPAPPGLDVPRVPSLTRDFFDAPRSSGGTTEAGPFSGRSFRRDLVLRAKGKGELKKR